MSTTTTSGTFFKPELVTEMFSKVKGHSTLAKLCGASPMPFAGTEHFIFSMDGEASIVGEGNEKPPGNAKFGTKIIVPVKFVYQHRMTDEFVHLSEEKQLPYMRAFTDGFGKKMSRALDIAGFHGVNPYDGEESATVGDNCFVKAIKQTVEYDSAHPDDNIDDAVEPIQDADGDVSGIAMTPIFGSALGHMKMNDSGTAMFPEFRFGGKPSSFCGVPCDINNTLAFGGSDIKAIVGDFANAFRWGYAEKVKMEIIEYGNPDGLGDLKRMNQIVLRAEGYMGWGILDPESFALITATA